MASLRTHQLPREWWGYCPYCGREGPLGPGRHQCDRCGKRFALTDWIDPAYFPEWARTPNPLKEWDDEDACRHFGILAHRVLIEDEGGWGEAVQCYALARELALRGIDPWAYLCEHLESEHESE